MGNCLVKKLQQTVEDENLCKLNEISFKIYRIPFKNDGSQTPIPGTNTEFYDNNDFSFRFEFINSTIVEIYDDNNNLLNIEEIKQKDYTYSNYNYVTVKISNKYNLFKLISNYNSSFNISLKFVRTINLNIDRVISNFYTLKKYGLYGDLEDLSGYDGEMLKIYNDNIICKKPIEQINLNFKKSININFANTDLYGNWAEFCRINNILPNSYYSEIFRPNLYADIEELDELLKQKILANPNISADDLTNIKGISITGDISKINNYCSAPAISGNNNNNLYQWTHRPTDYKILALENIILGNYVDRMLINQAQCVAVPNINGYAHKSRITVYGTRTSASDEAVQTLTGKGYTVIVSNKTITESMIIYDDYPRTIPENFNN